MNGRGYVDATAAPGRSGKMVFPTIVGGAGRLSRQMLPTIRSFNRTSEEIALLPSFVDRRTNKAELLARTAISLGVPATGATDTIEAAATDLDAVDATIWNATDHPLTHERVLKSAVALHQNVIGSLLVRFVTNGDLWVVRYAFRKGDAAGMLECARLFTGLSPFTPEGHSDDVLGPRWADGAVAEPLARTWIAAHVTDTFERFAADLPLKYHPIEVTPDAGATTLPLVVSREPVLQDQRLLSQRFYDKPPFPTARAQDYLIAECAPEAVRFTGSRLFRTDDRIRLRGSIFVPRIARPADVRPADRRTVTKNDHVVTTD